MTKIGYHGTSRRHHSSLDKGIKPVASDWDANSGGELGQGFYVANNIEAATIYGYGVCTTQAHPVAEDNYIDIWAVYSSVELDQLNHFAVSSQQTWSKFPKSYFDNFHFVYLYNDPGFKAALSPPRKATKAEIPEITQIKFNPNIFPFGVLTLAFHKKIAVNDALG
ncbi:hypothetical protein [Roseococcus pinisoli]|uniref:DUF3990 domain-containing protein n=1 Tax=Roseococcus pinisoli TaxID=2835040 RepID=A0ABS5Q6Z8_9PROT|nr:hypothetical protein [Roseococcus pinisoli]MBS7809400.1 hypothetical protein [Roseococcus pinisoli]